MSTIPIGAHVDCVDRPSGHCETLIVNPVTRQVTHVVVADKHLPNPTPRLVLLDRVREKGDHGTLSAIDHVGDETVYLKLDKRVLDLLPAIPVKHHWFEPAGICVRTAPTPGERGFAPSGE